MHMPRLIRKEQIISYVSLEKRRLMNGLASQLRAKDKLGLRWRKKDYLLIQEMISQYNLRCILIHRCGNKDEMRLHYLYKD